MIKKFIRSYLILNLLLLASAAAAQTPSGVIRGTVLDAKSKQPVIGASVSVDGTAMGTATDLEGKFLLTGVPAGPCSVRISFLSYKPFTSGPLTIKGGESTELNVELVEEVSELENVVVVATRKVNSDAGLLSQMREMSLVASGTSAQAIAKTQDRDAAEVVRRIPGISILDDKFVVVRGLAQRYNNVWINGGAVPSSEADTRSFSFDILPSSQLDNMKTKYSKAETNVETIQSALEKHQVQLLKDIAMLDKMYELNMAYFKELSMYILAGKKKLADFRAHELQQAMDKAKASGLPEDAQAARDLADQCERFEKKLYDLELTRTISLQMGPQIRLLQNNNSMMAEKIQSTIVNTIPLWKNQMVLALGLAHSQQAMQAERAVTDMTNELLKKNADALKMGTIETAKESQRGVVDIETLQQTNKSLIETLDELNKIQSEGRAKRAAAEQELTRIEDELKQKMMEIRS